MPQIKLLFISTLSQNYTCTPYAIVTSSVRLWYSAFV